MSILQGFRGFATFDPAGGGSAVQILCRPGARLTMPRNLDTPYPISNQIYGILNVADGLRFPVLELPMVPMASWFTTTNLQAWFQTRGVVDDLSQVTGGIGYADANLGGSTTNASLGIYFISGVKGASYRLSTSQGEPLGFTTRFVGTSAVQALPAVVPVPALGLAGAPLEFNSVSFTGALANTGIIGFSLDVDNGMTPNPTLVGTGTLFPSEINAGITTARFTVQTNGGIPLADGSTGAIVISSPPGTTLATFNLPDLVSINPDDRNQQAGRVIRTFNYISLASTTVYAVGIA